MIETPLRRLLTTALLTLVAITTDRPLASGVAAQSPAGLVRIDFRAVGADGQPVLDLKPAEVTLRIGGKARELRALDLVRASEGGGEATTPVPAAPPFATNIATPAAGRTILLAVDDESVAPGRDQALKAAMLRIVAGVGPRDRVGLLSVSRANPLNVPAGTDHATVRSAVEKLAGIASTETPEVFRCRTSVTLNALQAIFTASTGETPITVVFFTASLMQPGEAIGRMATSSDLCRVTTENFERVGQAAASSRAHFYVVHYVDGTTMPATEAAAGIESLAGVTGTETFRLVGSGDAFADRVLHETSAYYFASFEPEPGDRSGTSQRVELRVAREGVKVRARPGLTLARAEGKSGGKASPRDMLRVPTVYTDLPIRAAGFASRNPGDDKLRVIALFEPIDPAAKLTGASVGLFAADGKLTSQWTAQEAELSRSPIVAALTVPKGTYRMRVATVDGSGRGGTADSTLVAEMGSAGPIQMSAMMVGVAQNGFAPKLLFGPQDLAAVGYLEIYGVPKGAAVTATLELAPSEDAPAIASTPATVGPGKDQDARLVYGGFTIEALPPGDVVMRALLSLDGKVVGRAVRTMRKAGS